MTTSSNLGLDLQTTGSNSGTWGVVLNANQSIIDSRMGARLTKAVGGSANITVSASEAQNLRHNLTGVLTGNIKYIYPATGGFYIVKNATTGSFTLTIVNDAGGTGLVIPQGSTMLVFSNPDDTTVSAALDYLASMSIGTLTLTGSASAGVLTTNSSGVVATNTTLPDARMPALTGDVTTSAGAVATTIAAGSVTLAKMANMATASMLGRATAGTGAPEVLSASSARTNMGLGTSAVLDVGTTASKVVQLTAAAKLPAVDGSLLTNVAGVPVVTNTSTGKIVTGAITTQWGTGTMSGATTVTFGTAFSSAPYAITLTPSQTTLRSTNLNATAASTTNFVIPATTNGDTFYWTAIGPT